MKEQRLLIAGMDHDSSSVRERRFIFDAGGGEAPPITPSADDFRPSTAEQKLTAELEKETDADFQDQPLTDVVSFFNDYHGINPPIEIDEAAQDKRDTPVTYKATGVRLKSALNDILKKLGLVYVVENERMKITVDPKDQQEKVKTDVAKLIRDSLASEDKEELKKSLISQVKEDGFLSAQEAESFLSDLRSVFVNAGIDFPLPKNLLSADHIEDIAKSSGLIRPSELREIKDKGQKTAQKNREQSKEDSPRTPSASEQASETSVRINSNSTPLDIRNEYLRLHNAMQNAQIRSYGRVNVVKGQKPDKALLKQSREEIFALTKALNIARDLYREKCMGQPDPVTGQVYESTAHFIKINGNKIVANAQALSPGDAARMEVIQANASLPWGQGTSERDKAYSPAANNALANRNRYNDMNWKNQQAADAQSAAAGSSMGQSSLDGMSPGFARHISRLANTGNINAAKSRPGYFVAKNVDQTRWNDKEGRYDTHRPEDNEFAAAGAGFAEKEFVRGQMRRDVRTAKEKEQDAINKRNLGINAPEFIARVHQIQEDENYKSPRVRDLRKQFERSLAALQGKPSDSNEMTHMEQHIMPDIEQQLRNLSNNTDLDTATPEVVDGGEVKIPVSKEYLVKPGPNTEITVMANGKLITIKPNLQGGLWNDAKTGKMLKEQGISFNVVQNTDKRTRESQPTSNPSTLVLKFNKPGLFTVSGGLEGGETIDLRSFEQQLATIKNTAELMRAIRSLDGDRSKKLVESLGEKADLTIDWAKIKQGKEQAAIDQLSRFDKLTLQNVMFDASYKFGRVPNLTVECADVKNQGNLGGLFAEPRQKLTIRGLTSMNATAIVGAAKTEELSLPDLRTLDTGAGDVIAGLNAKVIHCDALSTLSAKELSAMLPDGFGKPTVVELIHLENLQISSEIAAEFAFWGEWKMDRVRLGKDAQEKIDEWILENRKDDENAVTRLLKTQDKIGVEATRAKLLEMSEKNPVARLELFRNYAQEIEANIASKSLVDQWMLQRVFGSPEYKGMMNLHSMQTASERLERSRLFDLLLEIDTSLDQKSETLPQNIKDIVDGEYDKYVVWLGQEEGGLRIIVRDEGGKVQKKFSLTETGDMAPKDLKALKKLLGERK